MSAVIALFGTAFAIMEIYRYPAPESTVKYKPVVMSYEPNSISEQRCCYYLTLNVVDCIDIFIRPVFKQIIVESLNHFIDKKGLQVYAWCLLTNQLHLVVEAREGINLPLLISDFKRFTTKIILADIDAETAERRYWILKKFHEAGASMKSSDKYQVWQPTDFTVPIDLENGDHMNEQVEFIHNRPVRDRIVGAAEDYLHSSAKDQMGSKGLVTIQPRRQRGKNSHMFHQGSSYKYFQ